MTVPEVNNSKTGDMKCLEPVSMLPVLKCRLNGPGPNGIFGVWVFWQLVRLSLPQNGPSDRENRRLRGPTNSNPGAHHQNFDTTATTPATSTALSTYRAAKKGNPSANRMRIMESQTRPRDNDNGSETLGGDDGYSCGEEQQTADSTADCDFVARAKRAQKETHEQDGRRIVLTAMTVMTAMTARRP
ncbi:hypothetical protein K490DRAFT_64164 [Saccharata proteae CBS 121410]|uniref:Uncharacterized protein n=1 Tax=Saccharata proteae CBS 121410 TaxID=1314787 RepID=A0A6A5YB51_9PEZI|nr:hypothetical protein K490DRAFT_64164 [Saccharata proteae CBS 121410]